MSYSGPSQYYPPPQPYAQQQQAYALPQGQYAHPPPAYQTQAQYMNNPPVQYGPPSNPSMQLQQPQTLNYVPQGPPSNPTMQLQRPQAPAQYMPQGPPNPYPQTAGGSRILHIYSTSWTQSGAQILDSDKSTVLYTIDNSSWSKPHMKIYAGNNKSGNPIGTVSFHLMSSKIDINVHGKAITLQSGGVFSGAYEYNSPAFSGQRLKWRTDKHSEVNVVCEMQGGGNGNMPAVARFLETEWARKKEGRLELGGMVVRAGPAMDEIVVAGIAVVELKRKAKAAANGVDAGSSLGGAGA